MVLLLAAIRHVSVLLSLRTLPFAIYAMLSLIPARRKMVMGLMYALVSGLAWRLGAGRSLVFILIGAIYYLLISLGANAVSDLLRGRRLTRGGLAVVLFGGCLLVPGVLMPEYAADSFLIVGWELALSAYSYCVETSRDRRLKASLGDCLFFLLVNPTLLYTSRGNRIECPSIGRGLGRTSIGVLLIFLGALILRPFATHLKHGSPATPVQAVATASFLLYGLARFIALYSAHSGLASIQIGLMRHVGWNVPERYVYPFLATSPMDFWRRWNGYVRVWLQAYVFLPLARRVSAQDAGRGRQVMAAVVTLIVSGLIHDAYVLAGRQTLDWAMTKLFLAAGVVLALWRLSGRLPSTVRTCPGEGRGRLLHLVTQCSARAGVAAAVIAAAAVWG